MMQKTVLILLSLLLCLFMLCAAAEEEATRFYDTLQYGDTGEDVLALQTRLKELGYYSGPLSSKYAELTRKAVREVQDVYGLEVSGIADNDTQTLIFSTCYKPLKYGDSGSLVQKMQERLKELGYLSARATGSFYQQTQAALKAFQDDYGL